METIQQQIGALQVIVAKQQVSVKRQRFAINALAGIILAGVFIAAVRPAGDAAFDRIICKGWTVVDKDDKMRITASTSVDGGATVRWLDKDGKMRISAGTLPDENMSVVTWYDKDQKARIAAATYDDGTAGMAWLDQDKKRRIDLTTNSKGTASMVLQDKDGNLRILSATFKDGIVALPIEDLSPPQKP